MEDYVLNVSAASVAPTVTTQAVSSFTATTATGNGNITSLGSPNPTVSGICWNTSTSPTTSNFKTTNGPTGVTGAYTGSLTSLSANTTYYVRAYATNTAGTSYGSEVSFTTSGIAPTVTTQAVSSITATTATGNGSITSLGVPNPTAYGVCWNTGGTPTTSDSKVNNGAASATGAFAASITGLNANTTYHVRAFATNTAGTSYGTEVTFTTSAITPTVTTQAVSSITTTTATGNGNITSLGVPNPTAYGVCWNTGGTPTTSDSKVNNGAASATGAFAASITGLNANTIYHVRAYATNTAGTSYGTEVTFTTNAIAPTVTTQAVSSITTTTATGNGSITSLGVPNPTAYGVCWNTGGTPTTSDSKVNNGAASATGAFAASITGLNANTTYHVRAYATNTAGTSYGTEVTFTTSAIAPTVTTQAVSSITATTATGNGNITSLGVPNPSAYGVCWGTTSGAETATGSHASNGSASATGTFTASMTGLAANTTYYVKAYATNTAGTVYGSEVSFTTLTPGTWTGNASSQWTNANNWAGGAVPNSTTDVTIPSSGISYLPMIFPTDNAECNNFTVADGCLEIQSSSSGTGSLIVYGTAYGRVGSDVYLTANQWHIVAPPTNGADISSFISYSGNSISNKINGAITTYAITDYNENYNAWNSYFTNATWGTFDSGKGYLMRHDNNYYISFYGSLVTGTKTVSLTKVGEGWNCIGNPYTSAIGMNSSATSAENFLTKNSSMFDPNYACVYIWDGVSSTYKILGNLPSGLSSGRLLTQNYVQVGQEFFVKAKDASQTASFTAAMQSHQNNTNAPFKTPAVTTSWPGIALNVASADASSSAIITFNSNMTKGLDPTYDAGLLRGTNGLSLYTRLLEDNGVDFAIQCLPENYNNLVIPVGVDCKDGGEITFSAESVELPKNCNVIIEDRATNTFASLAEGGTYKTTVSAGSTAVGRFYIHTSENTTTVTSGLTAETSILKAYISNEAIIIEGEVSDQAIATLYNLQGLKLHVNALQKGSLNTLPCSDLIKGIYLLTIQQNGKTETKKLIKE